MSYQDWNISWPGIIFKSTTIRLPVNFELELDERCAKGDAGNFIWSRRSLKSPSKPILDIRTQSSAWVCFQ
jgi:hypothetical protein